MYSISCCRGVNQVLKKRLQAYYKQHHLQSVGLSTSEPEPYDFYLVVDFEATCTGGYGRETWPHEIIEFPIVVIDGHTQEVVSCLFERRK